MNTDLLIVVMTVFVAISAIALCVQAGLLFGMYKASKALQEQVTSVLPQVKTVLSKAESTLDENRKQIVEIMAKVNDITIKGNDIMVKGNDLMLKAGAMMDVGKAQLMKLDDVVSDASARAKVQIERAELVVDDTVSRVHDSVSAIHHGIIKPIREVQGISAGFKAALQHLVRGGRPNVDQATQDDEMFI